MSSIAGWLKKLRPRKAAPEPQLIASPAPVGLGGSKPVEFVIIEDLKTVLLYIENEASADAYQEFFDHVKKKGYYLQVLQFKK